MNEPCRRRERRVLKRDEEKESEEKEFKKKKVRKRERRGSEVNNTGWIILGGRKPGCK